MPAIFSKPRHCRRHIPHFRRSPNEPPPKYKALVIGINYMWSPDGLGPGDPDLQLKGPVNDAKDIKKTLKELYYYREQDIFLMTDEEDNKGSDMWPDAANILRAIDNLVHDASPRDVFVFYYAGHCDRQVFDGAGDKHTYIIACDSNHILDDTLRERLVDPLPVRSLLTAIMDACYSGPLLALNHYRCHCFLRQRCQSLSPRRRNTVKALRRHSEAARHLVLHSTAFLYNFSSVVTATLAIIRLKSRRAKRFKSKKREDNDGPQPPTAPTPTLTPTPTPTPVLVHCSICNRDHDLSSAPDVISLSPCTEDQRTWEDTTRKGKGMTVKLIKILKKDPSINLGDLNQQMKCLSKLSFKRVRKTTAVFRCLSKLVSPSRKQELERKYKDQGIFEFKDQTAQFGGLRTLRPDDRFILEREWGEHQSDPD